MEHLEVACSENQVLNLGVTPLDRTDREILACLQEDATMPVAEIASQVGLTQNPCWRRIKRLEAIGVIQRPRRDRRRPIKLGLGLTVFVSVRTNQHNGRAGSSASGRRDAAGFPRSWSSTA